jgi:hypothetical protein
MRQIVRQFTALCTKSAAYVAKMEFNTGIETLTIFLVSVVTAGHQESFVLSTVEARRSPPRNGPADLKE